jgi:hypothetical protein
MQYKRRHLQGNSRQVPLSAIKDEEGRRSKVEEMGTEAWILLKVKHLHLLL